MKKTLHILNGDSVKTTLKQSKLQGDVLVFREMLCEGSIIADIGSDKFWIQRYDFFNRELGVEKLEYYDKTIKELVKIEDLSAYDEVILWFEYDLFCQVNLMALSSYLLKHYRSAIYYYLVCVGKEHGENEWKALTDYHPEDYKKLYENKIKLSRNDLQFATNAWQTYVKNDKTEIEAFDFKKTKKFCYFDIAMQQHLLRFNDKDELNQISRKILEIIGAKSLSEKEIIKELLNWQRKETVYGFGDLQYALKLKKLSKFYEIKDGLYHLKN